ncbi:Two-component system sensor histidine kinase/response [Xanthomarina gelatinilytica]|uniref:Two-component system sensor histidine kinase/response n=1 Tax=Xanthomarina gelatinilytica TaxID=1137281 RepID=M7N096_9FLAO|nr:two-component regulator propeller domain-containing protein [Xanthomarina gelatinilytica]EMQ95169.1 Two-component system sensor histidine kinase/response [Xanthomarina gelatinilytica]
MNIKIELIYLIFILTLTFSCSENKKSNKEFSKSEFVRTLENDTLKFTSGIRAIFQDSKGNYWLGSHNEGISHYDGKTFEYFTTNDGLASNQIRSIQEDKNGIIWIGTAKGVCSYNRENFTNYLSESNSPKFDWNATDGNLWFYAGEEDGINRFDGINMNYLIFPKPKNDNPNKSYGVTDISKDKDGIVWIATYSTLFNYDGKTTNIYDHKNLKLKDNEVLHIRSVLADSKGRIWIGNNGIGVILKSGDLTIHFSKEQGKLIPMKEFKSNIQNGQTTKNTGLQSVFAIEEDNEGNIWFADRDSGVWKYNGESLTNFTIDEKLKSQMIWDIYLDKNKTLLFGMADGGVYKFNGKSFDKRF